MEVTTDVGRSAPGAAVGLASDRLWFALRCNENDRYSILVRRKCDQIRISVTDRRRHDDREVDHGTTIRVLTTCSEHRAVVVIGLLCAHQDPPAFIDTLVHPADMVDGDVGDLDLLEGERIVAAFRKDRSEADAN